MAKNFSRIYKEMVTEKLNKEHLEELKVICKEEITFKPAFNVTDDPFLNIANIISDVVIGAASQESLKVYDYICKLHKQVKHMSFTIDNMRRRGWEKPDSIEHRMTILDDGANPDIIENRIDEIDQIISDCIKVSEAVDNIDPEKVKTDLLDSYIKTMREWDAELYRRTSIHLNDEEDDYI